MFNEFRSKEIQKKIFDVSREKGRKGAWWWWFWLFIWDNPKNPEKPKQLMILWSTKQDKKIICNDLEIVLNHEIAEKTGRKEMDGAVAAWYFDGEKMHHNFLLEQCCFLLDNSIVSKSTPETKFTGKQDNYTVQIGEDMLFNAVLNKKNSFTIPEFHQNEYFGKKVNYKILRLNKLSLSGKVHGKPINGSAYFQRVFVNAPAIPWYWGILHFKSGQILTYFKPYFLGKAIKKDISFWDGKELHKFNDLKIRKKGITNPTFFVSGENTNKKISFEVHTYAHSSWTFKKKLMKLVYNEYPAVLKKLVLEDKKTGKKILQKEFGQAVGNAEHTTGFLA